MKLMKHSVAALLLLLAIAMLPAHAYAEEAEFTYRLTLTDQSGREVYNPRGLSAGDTLQVEIELRREGSDDSYEAYGMEFRLDSQGLEYRGDGASFRQGTAVTKQVFDSGDSVGFAFYDMERKGERVGNPVLAGRWSYTVSDPGVVNITVPVALLYVVGRDGAIEPVGNARLFLDPNGGRIVGEDVSGEYPSGTVVRLPDASFADYVFDGWGLGSRAYRAGDDYTVTGVTTLTAQWEGLVRNRQVLFEPNGGTFSGADPSGMYADGETVSVPKAEKDGFALDGWSMGGGLYRPGDVYVVDNSVVFAAEWSATASGPGTPGEALLLALCGLGAIGAGWWLLLLLWRRYVRYSLLDGGVLLSYRDARRASTVQVYLDRDGEACLLGQSGTVDAGERLRRIEGAYVLLGLKKGFHKGHLHVTYADGKEPRDIGVRIHALKKEYNGDDAEQ